MTRQKHTAASAATGAPHQAPGYHDLVTRTPANDAGPLRVEAAGDGEPRVRDVDLAERLGYERPRKVRALIERHAAELRRYGALSMRPVVERIEKTGAIRGIEEREVMEYWLNEGQAIDLCALSRTDLAIDVREEVIRVFMAVRHGRALPAPQPPAPALSLEQVVATLMPVMAQMVAQAVALALAPITAQIALMEARLGVAHATSGTLSAAVASSIKYRLREAAKVVVGSGRAKSVRSARCKLEQRLRGAVRWAGSGCTIANMPVASESIVLRELEMIEREVDAVAEALRAQRQMRLDEIKPGKADKPN